MEQSGLGPQDLIPFIGGRNRVYEVLAGKRQLTLKMIRRLHDGLGIPAELLIGAASGERPDALWLDAAGVEVTGYPVAENFAEIACFV